MRDAWTLMGVHQVSEPAITTINAPGQGNKRPHLPVTRDS